MMPPKHPDARLLELGQQFEDAKDEHRRLWLVRAKLKKLTCAVAAERGIDANSLPPDPAFRKLCRKTGYQAAMAATDVPIGRAIALANDIYRQEATTMEGVAVKLAAIVFDMFGLDFDPPMSKAQYAAEKGLIRLRKQVDSLLKERKPGRVAELYSRVLAEDVIANLDGVPDADSDAHVINVLAPIEDELLGTPAYTLQEFAMKVRVADPLFDELKDEMNALIQGQEWRP